MYDSSTFAKGTGVSLAVVAVIGLVVATSGTAYAASLAGVGGFTIEADEIRGYGAVIYVGADDTSEREAIPMAVTELQRTEIDGLRLTKDVPVDQLPGVSGNARMVITGNGTSTTGQQIMKASSIRADEAVLRRQIIDETPSEDPRRKFNINARGEEVQGLTVNIDEQSDAPGLVLREPSINAHYLATNKITIPGQHISLQYDPDGDGEYEERIG